MDGLFQYFANYQTLFSVAGVIAIFVAILSPISTQWFSISLALYQRILLGVIGVIGIGIALLSTIYNSKAELPIGSILAWSSYSNTNIELPLGWIVCGQNKATPNLDGQFLMGVNSVPEAGKTGGKLDIPQDGSYKYTGTTHNDQPIQTHAFRCEGNCTLKTEHNHTFEISAPSHNHGGENRPPYYTVLFLCKIK